MGTHIKVHAADSEIFTLYKTLRFRARRRRVGHALVTLFLLLSLAKRVEIEEK